MIRTTVLILGLAVGLTGPGQATARGTYQEPQAFIAEIFAGNPPAPASLWLRGELKEDVRRLLGHDPGVLRVRYWARDGRTAWILEEVGKEQPITTGVVVAGDRIEEMRVLVFRETRGWEVRYPFFTDQFRGATLTDGEALDRPVDGISGATLSVRAMEKVARLALLLNAHTPDAAHGGSISQAR